MKLIFESSLFGVDSTDQFNTLVAIAIFPKHPVTSIRGSIDKLEIRNLCCDILEGGKQAFINRQKLYGLPS